MSGTPLVLCAKSTWRPAIRREHALAAMAARHGHPVRFVERPLDVRALRSGQEAPQWLRGLRGAGTTVDAHGGGTVEVLPTSAIVPGHRDRLGEVSSTALLRHALRRASSGGRAAIVANLPWQWPAVRATPAARRVFDCADDWSELMPHRRARINELYRRIGEEADAVIVANAVLAERFPSERTVVVRNGVADALLAPVTAPPSAQRLVYTGTLTPRFDAPLVGRALDALPGWTLDLYGQCQYPGAGDAPGPELAALLDDRPGRVRWHGVVSREALAAVIDDAAVAILPNRPELSLGQDAMKLYDYAARGRPIVSTRFDSVIRGEGPPHTQLIDTAAELAQAVLTAAGEPEAWRLERRRWAEGERWETRWPAWSAAAFGAR